MAATCAVVVDTPAQAKAMRDLILDYAVAVLCVAVLVALAAKLGLYP